jgi:hypothetical protein
MGADRDDRPMADLTQLLREAAESGRLTGFTIWPTPQGWQASARFAGSDGWNVQIDPDPAIAATAALGAKPEPSASSIFD